MEPGFIGGVGVGRKLACGLAPWGTECQTKPVIVNPECGQGSHPLSSCPGVGGGVGYQNYLRGFSCEDTVSECVLPNPLPRTVFTDRSVSHFSGVLGVKTSLRVMEQDFNDLNFFFFFNIFIGV